LESLRSKSSKAGIGVTQGKPEPNNAKQKTPYQRMIASSYYGVLGVDPSASVQQIRQAYRDLSKQYHPDTTKLSATIATGKFQELNEAYATLSNPERRLIYDRKIGYSSVPVVQPLPTLHQARSQSRSPEYSSSAYLDATDRPLSPGEMFALFILGLTFVACLILAITIGVTRGEDVIKPIAVQSNSADSIVLSKPVNSVLSPPTQLNATPPAAIATPNSLP
jgi:hypothetical protein